MKGSEKQIKWAKDIVSGWNMQIDKLVDDAKRRVEVSKDMPPVWLEIAERIAEQAKQKINNVDDASIIIRDRKADVSGMVFKMMSAEYDKANK